MRIIRERNYKIVLKLMVSCYGPEKAIKKLSQRIKGRKGNVEHEKAVEEEKRRREEEKTMLSI